MAAALNFRSALKTLEPRSCQLLYIASRAQSSSSWISPSRRHQLSGRCASKQQRRPIVNGKKLPLHINDLKQQQHAASFSFPTQQQQQRHRHRLRKNPPRKYESDLVVVLDMDECLIHSQFLDGPSSKYTHQVQRKGPTSLNGGATKSVDTFNITLPNGTRVLVNERPHVHEFLQEVSSKYETHVLTAGLEMYAKPVLEKLDPHGNIFTGVWYRDSCQLDSKIGAYIKDLGMFSEFCETEKERQQRLNRTVLVDNNPLSFLANPEHGILVSSFYDDGRDSTLPAVLDLLHELDKHEDVRPVLDARFKLRQALNDLTKGRPFAGRRQQIDEQQQEQTSIAIAT